MTKVIVNSGACGFTVAITAEKGKDKKVLIALDTACEMVQKMLADIATVDHRVTLTGFRDNPVYLSAAKHLKHVACPVPSAILKAIEKDLETFAGERLDLPRPQLARLCENVVRNYDPCISCATHALTVTVDEQ